MPSATDSKTRLAFLEIMSTCQIRSHVEYKRKSSEGCLGIHLLVDQNFNCVENACTLQETRLSSSASMIQKNYMLETELIA